MTNNISSTQENSEYNSRPGSPSGAGGKIFLIGFMGCGKSHWGRQLAQHLRMPFFDLDEQIESSEGKAITRIFAEEGEEYFRQKEKEVLTILTESHEAFVMATGGGTPCFFNNIDYMNKAGTTVWINCSAECLQKRLLNEKDKRPLVRNLADEHLQSYIIKKLGDRKIYYQQATVILHEDDLTLENFLEKIFQPENH